MDEARFGQSPRPAMNRMDGVLSRLVVDARADDETNTEGDGARRLTGSDQHDENRR